MFCFPKKKKLCITVVKRLNFDRIILIFLVFLLFVASISDLTVENASAYPYITVTSPSSGETLYRGEYKTISWSSAELDGDYVRIDLYDGSTQERVISTWTENDGGYSWYVSTSLSEGSNYRIKISDYYNSSTYDFSGYFTIKIRRTLTVTTPSYYSTWYKGENYNIYWNSQNAGSYVNISLYKNDVFSRTISSYTSNDGSYYWYLPINDIVVGDDYKVKVSSLTYSEAYDYSSAFTIDERTIEMVSPKKADVGYKDYELDIEWNSENAGSTVKIDLYEDDSYKSTIISSTSNDGEYTWTIDAEPSTYRIRVSSYSYPYVYDESDVFTINERSLSFTTIFSGKTWFPNETHLIEWIPTNAGDFVDLILYKDNVYCGTIADDIANTGSYTWNIYKYYPPDDGYHMMIRSTEYSSIKDQSGKFSIGGRELEIKNIEKNEVYYLGDEVTVEWDSNNAGEHLDIVLYLDGEALWTIASNVKASDGEYSWVIPENLSEDDNYQIKIESSAYSNVSSLSESFAVEQTLMDKIRLPLMIIIGTIVGILCVVGVVTLIKRRKNKVEKVEKSPEVSYKSYQQKGIIKNDSSQKEYDEIWEKNNY